MSEEQGTYGVKVIDKRIPVEEETRIVPHSDNAFLTLFQIAAQKGYDPEFISKMMDLQKKNDEYEAKKAYVKAMADFKADPPKIDKDRKVSYKAGAGTTEYTHASLSNVSEKINFGLSRHGLSASWTTTQTNGSVTVTCKITHSQGHSEETSLTASPDTSGSKNAIQAIGSTISYLERYTLLALTGLATSDMDDDGHGAEVKYISDEQKKTIEDLMKERSVDKVKFLNLSQAKTIEEILAEKYNKAVAWLKACPKPKKEREPGSDDDK